MAEKKSRSRADAVRQAVDQAFQSQVPRERVQELVDELASTAGRLRSAVDDLRPATGEEVKALRGDLLALRADMTALQQRVDALEAKPAGRGATAKKSSAKKTTAAKPRAKRSPPEGGATPSKDTS